MDTGEIPDLAETSAQTANPPPATGARLGFLPGFLTPASRRTDPLTQELPSLDPEGGDDADPYGPPSRRPDRGTRTPTSATGKPERPDLAVTAELVVGLLGLAVAGAAWLVARRHRRTRVLREPTDRQLADVAEPMAKILRRHADAAWLHPDLADAIKAGAGVGRYLNAGPLTEPLYTDPGEVPGSDPEDTPR